MISPERTLSLLSTLTIVAGSIVTAALTMQIAVNAASDIHYWDVGVGSSGRSIWFGVLAAGLLLAGTILVQQRAMAALVCFAISIPLLVLYERDHNTNFLSISVSRTLGSWLWVAALLLVIMAYACWNMGRDTAST